MTPARDFFSRQMPLTQPNRFIHLSSKSTRNCLIQKATTLIRIQEAPQTDTWTQTPGVVVWVKVAKKASGILR